MVIIVAENVKTFFKFLSYLIVFLFFYVCCLVQYIVGQAETYYNILQEMVVNE